MSLESDKLYQFMIQEYLESGYLYSGAIACNGRPVLELVAPANIFDVIEELLAVGLVEYRNCQGFSIQLPVEKRAELIKAHSLTLIWEQVAPHFYPNSLHGEINLVLAEERNKSL